MRIGFVVGSTRAHNIDAMHKVAKRAVLLAGPASAATVLGAGPFAADNVIADQDWLRRPTHLLRTPAEALTRLPRGRAPREDGEHCEA